MLPAHCAQMCIARITGLIQFNAKDVALSYLSGWFVLDLIASIPFDKVVPAEDHGGESAVLPFEAHGHPNHAGPFEPRKGCLSIAHPRGIPG